MRSCLSIPTPSSSRAYSIIRDRPWHSASALSFDSPDKSLYSTVEHGVYEIFAHVQLHDWMTHFEAVISPWYVLAAVHVVTEVEPGGTDLDICRARRHHIAHYCRRSVLPYLDSSCLLDVKVQAYYCTRS